MRGALHVALVGALVGGCGDAASSGVDGADAQVSALDGVTDDTGPAAGVAVGEALADLTVLDCDGRPVALRGLGPARAGWLMLAHGWCPHCQAASAFAEAVRDDYAARGVVVANILVQDAVGAPPTAASCASWRADMAQDDVVTLYDPDGATGILWAQPFTALNVFLDGALVIHDKLHTDDRGAIEAAIDAALGGP